MSRRRSNRGTVRLRIDQQLVEVNAGLTILEAARTVGLYIPTLCAHEQLLPFGGCRLCVVEVDGMRGFPTACTTPVAEGMVVRTHTAQLQQLRGEILRLILSEHPAGCLICNEREECRDYVGTIRKAGVTTGCRYCPNDRQCELQELVERLGINDIGYPVYYRGLRVEKEDPFYDRDYNLCVLCGRCVRVCQEIRLANTLSFNQRGRHTVIGPAFHRTHLQAGCEFCGACVEVCPTGALAEKFRKWEGKAERQVSTTCPLCGLGCQLRLEIKQGEVIGSLPDRDPLGNDGQLCVKGRFCVAELVTTRQRARRPALRRDGAYVDVDWERALREVGARLNACRPEEFGMVVSADHTSEHLYMAFRFAREAMGSRQADTPARWYYGPSLWAYLGLFARSVPLAALRRAGVLVCVGLDTRFALSVVGVELRRARQRGARIITVNAGEHNLSLVADIWLRPQPGQEPETLLELAGMLKEAASTHEGAPVAAGGELRKAVALLRNATRPVILVGPEFVQGPAPSRLVEGVQQLAEVCGAGVMPLPIGSNFLGAMVLGGWAEEVVDQQASEYDQASPPYAPGEPGRGELLRLDLEGLAERRLKVLYLVGENVAEPHRFAEFVVYQNCYLPGPDCDADVVLPSATFSEVDGTFLSGDGRVRRVRAAVPPPGEALPDWLIFSRLAETMGKSGFFYRRVRQVQAEMAARPQYAPLMAMSARGRRWKGSHQALSVLPKAISQPLSSAADSLRVQPYLCPHAYRGFPLGAFVEGARVIFPEGTASFHPEDAAAYRLGEGDRVLLSGDGWQWMRRARLREAQSRGVVSVETGWDELAAMLPGPVKVRKNHA